MPSTKARLLKHDFPVRGPGPSPCHFEQTIKETHKSTFGEINGVQEIPFQKTITAPKMLVLQCFWCHERWRRDAWLNPMNLLNCRLPGLLAFPESLGAHQRGLSSVPINRNRRINRRVFQTAKCQSQILLHENLARDNRWRCRGVFGARSKKSSTSEFSYLQHLRDAKVWCKNTLLRRVL